MDQPVSGGNEPASVFPHARAARFASCNAGALSDRTAVAVAVARGVMPQALALLVFGVAPRGPLRTVAAVLLGLGTAAAYPTLVATRHCRLSGAAKSTRLPCSSVVLPYSLLSDKSVFQLCDLIGGRLERELKVRSGRLLAV